MSSQILDTDACYAALQAHDARFDGRFFCGVSSTGIYCRPVCRVKLPKQENCIFFISAAAAEVAGYRPCLRCRPELAPGLAPVDSAARLARSAAMVMEEGWLGDQPIAELADMLGVTDRHLRRVFCDEYGASPVQYLQTQRLLLAKNLLTDSSLKVIDVAMAAGFGSIRRFNDLCKKHYQLTPRQLRDKVRSSRPDTDMVDLSIGYRPPYAWDSMVSFLAARAIPGVETVSAGTYRRTVVINKGDTPHVGWISVSNRPQRHALAVSMTTSLLPVLQQVLVRVRFLFDVNCSPENVYRKLAVMNETVPGVCVPGVRVPGCFDPFEMAVRAILGQQVTVKAARTLAMRVAESFGEKISTTISGLSLTFPQPYKICALQRPIEDRLGPLGVTGARARSILALATAMNTNAVTLSSAANPRDEISKLLRLPGIGPWTAEYIALRGLGWPDAFPHTDYGVKKALAERSPQEILALAQTWSPWRSYATILLWNHLAKEP